MPIMTWLLKCTKHQLLLAIILWFTGCSTRSTDTAGNNGYFSMSTYMAEEAKRLESHQHTLIKTGQIGDSVVIDTVLIAAGDSVFWKRELAIFSDTDIGKAALRGKYAVDSLITIDPLSLQDHLLVRYIAKDDQLPVQVLDIHWQDSQVIKVELSVRADNAIYESDKQLTYLPNERYIISSSQEVLGGSRNLFRIENRWATP